MASIARRNLLEDIPRFLVAQAGIMFAVSLVTIQTGILNGFSRSTILLIESSQADIWVASDKMVQFELTEPLIFDQLNQAKKVEGVARAEGLIRGSGLWRPPEGEISPLTLIGFEPQGKLFQPGEVMEGEVSDLTKPYNIMVDRSRLSTLRINKLGDRAQIKSLPAQLVGVTSESQSLVASPFIFSSLENINAYVTSDFTSRLDCKLQSDNQVECTTIYEKSAPNNQTADSLPPTPQPLTSTDGITYILIKAKPGQDLEILKERLDSILLGTRAYTTVEMSQKTEDYWLKRTGIGFILSLGAIVGIIVGMVVVSQILYSSVSDHIKEFGTLKAMGAPDRMIYNVIIEQSLWMAILGYIPGMLICWGVSFWAATEGVIILITPLSAVGVLGITLGMCVGSAFFAIQKVTRIDPAIVFKA